MACTSMPLPATILDTDLQSREPAPSLRTPVSCVGTHEGDLLKALQSPELFCGTGSLVVPEAPHGRK